MSNYQMGRGGPSEMNYRGRGQHNSFGRGFNNNHLPEGYICKRCKEPGHRVENCPTNGDRTYDIYETKGIPINQVASNILGLNDKWKAHGADVVKSLLR